MGRKSSNGGYREREHRVCLSHFSELETGDKQAFDTHNQTPIETRIQTRFSDVVFIDPFLVGGIKRLSLLLCPAAVGSLTLELELHWESEMYTRIKTALRLSPCF